MVNETVSELMTFNRVESARILGIPATTLANWAEELGIAPLSHDAGTRGVPSRYVTPTLLRAAIAKTQLEGGLSKKAVRATAEVIVDLLSEAGVTSENKPIGGLIGTGKHLMYVPRENWDDPEKLQKEFSQQKDLFWALDLQPVLDKFLSSLQFAIDEKLGFSLWGPGKTGGGYRITLPDGTKFEGESFDSALEQFRVHHTRTTGQKIAAILGQRSRTRGIDPDVLDDMEDLARFVGYEDSQKFSEDIANVRKTLVEVSSK